MKFLNYILILASCLVIACSGVMDKKYNPDNIFYDLQEMPEERRVLIRAVHEEMQEEREILNVDRSYIKSMKYEDIFQVISKNIDAKRLVVKKALEAYYDERRISEMIRYHESNLIMEEVQKFESELQNKSDIGLGINGLITTKQGELNFKPENNPILNEYLPGLKRFQVDITVNCKVGGSTTFHYLWNNEEGGKIYNSKWQQETPRFLVSSNGEWRVCPEISSATIQLPHITAIDNPDEINIEEINLADQVLDNIRNEISNKIDQVIAKKEDKFFVINDEEAYILIRRELNILAENLYEKAKEIDSNV